MNKIKKKGKALFLNNNLVEKKDKDNIRIFNYLDSKDFKEFLKYENRIDDKSYYKYIKDYSINNKTKSNDLIKTISLLHNKTSYFKKTNKEELADLKNKITGYINYLEDYYNILIKEYEIKKYPSPSEIIFLCNYSKLLSLFTFLKEESQNLFDVLNLEEKRRICLNHKNLSLDHLLIGDKNYLISWDKAEFDTPVSDLVELYKNEWKNIEFSSLLEVYMDKCKISESEKKLFIISISIPHKFEKVENELVNTKNMIDLFDYINTTETLIRSYYSK